MVSIGFEVEDTAALERLAAIEHRLENPEGLSHVLVKDFHDYEQDAFDTSGFGSWAGDNAETVDLKGGSRVLVDTGALRASLVAGDGGVRVTGDDIEFTTSDVAAKFLAAGARGMSRRDPIPNPPASVLNRWAEQAAAYFVDGIE